MQVRKRNHCARSKTDLQPELALVYRYTVHKILRNCDVKRVFLSAIPILTLAQ